ncbi:MAG: hypothetical protein WC848_02880 [Parcubacteria group bacterium]|jgi:uncharacterized protein YeeX (DUF496 family)
MGIVRRLFASNAVSFALFCITCLVGGIVLRTQSLKAGLGTFAIGICLIAVVWLTDIIWVVNEQKQKGKSADGLGDEIIFSERKDTPLEYLAGFSLSSPRDGVVVLADLIFRRATRLLNYQAEDGVIGEVLNAYRSFIDQYVVRAAELVKKHRKAQEFLDNTDPEKLARIITDLRGKIKGGNVSLQSTLDEKQRTLEELGAMQESQSQSIFMLEKIDATLESMETLAVSAETNSISAKDVLDELQRTISSTSQAIKETLCNHGG